ncbi:tetratricopeptide repeat protein [Paracoccus sp. (in: a-proteobacteria)]
MLRGLIFGAAVALAGAGAALAQQAAPEAPAAAAAGEGAARTLADLRADLRAVGADLRALRAELSASGAEGFRAAGGESAIDRMNAMEREITRLTGETERLRHRIDRIVRDGSNRIGDIEFRLCEMEDGCDLGALTTTQLGDLDGGGAALMGSAFDAAPTAAPAGAGVSGALTAQEQAELDRARAALDAGDFPRAAELFGGFASTHAGSPAATEALYLQGAALDSAGDAKGATAAWLQAFAAAPTGPRAADALLGLSRVSAAGRPATEGCVYLDELIARFPGTPQADEAARRSASAGCAAAAGQP